jgi:glycosyltransferase involved in cell wall biosynthesis
MKVFFMCTHCNQATGYARVANKITNYLADLPGVEVVYYAFQNYPNQHIEDRFIDPRIKFVDALEIDPVSPKGFGDLGIVPTFDAEKPDVLFLYNDLPVCCAILKMLEAAQHKSYKSIAYLDIVYPYEDLERYEYLRGRVDTCLTFLECWRRHLVDDLGWDSSKVAVLEHGVDNVKELDPVEAKKKLGFSETDFIVLNLNRNSYRKQWVTTIQAFIIFLVRNKFNPRLKLMCGCLPKTDDGYDIEQLIRVECLRQKIDFKTISTNHIFVNPMAMRSSEESINVLYNAADVGLNTCCGEGFGLTNMEHACLGKFQIVSGVPAFKELLSNHDAIIVEPKVWTVVSRFESHGGDIAVFDPFEFAGALDYVFNFGHTISKKPRPVRPWKLESLAQHIRKD